MGLSRSLLLKQSEMCFMVAWSGLLGTYLLPCQAAQGISTTESQPHLPGCLKGNVAGDVGGVSGSALHPHF